MNKEEFVNEVRKLGIEVNEEKLKLLDKYYNLLVEWNEKINLTSITDEKEVYLKHFYDSLTLSKIVDLSLDMSMCDVGSGAGFPGIVLKIFFPNIRIKLIDSLQKRINYLNLVIEELGLKDITCEHVRMEDYSRLNEEKFDYITARAVANLGVLSEISVRSLKVGGYLIFMKGKCDEELDKFLNKSKDLGLSFEDKKEFLLPLENSNRTLISFKKISRTKDKYPRRIDVIKKEYL